MRVLIYGAGVIGSLYAALFAEAGIPTAVYARGERLAELKREGLRYRKNGHCRRAEITLLSRLREDDVYDFIFLAVREMQARAALLELRENQSPTIVTMVNTLGNYADWETLCGVGRILPAFPGAGGGFENGILEAALTPRLVQPTTFAVLRPEQREEARHLKRLFRRAGIPCQQVADMRCWQLCHLALVVPLADAYYEAKSPAYAGEESALMDRTARRLRRNMRALKRRGISLSPAKLQLFCFCPLPLLAMALRLVYRSRFGALFMYRHSMKAPDEMRQLHRQLYAFLRKTGRGTQLLDKRNNVMKA